MFFLSPRFGRIASGTGPRLPMTRRPDRRRHRPAAAAAGRRRRRATSPTCCPALLVFGLGLSATVAPLTATVLDSVEERHVGIASGVNNGVSRVAGLLAIAILGAVISAHFGSRPRRRLGAAPPLGPAARAPSPTPRNSRWRCRRPASLPPAEAARVSSRRGRRLDLRLPPRHRHRRRADDRRRHRRRVRDREPETARRGGAEPRRRRGRRVRPRRPTATAPKPSPGAEAPAAGGPLPRRLR